jgi:GTP 3',8-cyclase
VPEAPLTELVDPRGRRLTHLRLSVTERCNLQCFYCHREGQPDVRGEMSLEQVLDVVTAMGRRGMDRIKITGGEPLVRRDIVEIVAGIHATGLYRDISMTTNALRLPELAAPLARAGLQRVNIGCDSLSSSISPKSLERVLPGLDAARAAGLTPIKLNMVLMAGVNDHEVDALIDIAREREAILQLIELIPFGDGDFHQRYHVPLEAIQRRLEAEADEVQVRALQGRRQLRVRGAWVELVAPSHGEFCQRCSKLRVTADGRVKPCLMRQDDLVPFDGEASITEAVSRRR